jgi:hypothetical protein
MEPTLRNRGFACLPERPFSERTGFAGVVCELSVPSRVLVIASLVDLLGACLLLVAGLLMESPSVSLVSASKPLSGVSASPPRTTADATASAPGPLSILKKRVERDVDQPFRVVSDYRLSSCD